MSALFSCDVLKNGQTAVLVYVGDVPSQHDKEYAEQLSKQAGSTEAVGIHSVSTLASLPMSSFDVVCVVDPIALDRLNFTGLLGILKLNGTCWLKQLAVLSPAGTSAAIDKARSSLTLNGFVGATIEVSSLPVTNEVRQQLKSPFDCGEDLVFVSAHASKPSYEVGACAPVRFAVDKKTANAWTLSANDMVDDDILDSDAVLDADDLKKPDPASLKMSCGEADAGPAKRKACKNCTCGLVEELDAAVVKATAAAETHVPSCDKCYLGDAFRCSTCPYRGMPAFKKGEIVQLPATAMQDI